MIAAIDSAVASSRAFRVALAIVAAMLSAIAHPTHAQVKLAADIRAGTASSFPYGLFAWNGALYFQAEVSSFNYELVKYTGAQFTVMDINPTGTSDPQHFIDYNGYLYFEANDGVHGNELWRTDGTSAMLAADVFPGSDGSYAWDPVVHNNELYFVGTSTDYEINIFRFDGTNVNQVTQTGDVGPNQEIDHLNVLNGTLYFAGCTNCNDRSELWTWDGSSATQVSSFNPTSGGGVGDPFLVWNGWLWFRANTNAGGNELWRYNGTTFAEVAINPGGGDSHPQALAVYQNELYVLTIGGLHRIASPTSAPVHVADFNQGGGLGVSGGLLFISAAPAGTFTSHVFAWDGVALREVAFSPDVEIVDFQGAAHFSGSTANTGIELFSWVPPAASTTMAIPGSGLVDFGSQTAVDVNFSGVLRSTPGTCSVDRWERGLWDPQGIAEANISPYHWILTASDSLAFDAATEVRFRVSEIPNPGFTDPTAITVYRRDPADTLDFAPVTSSYDAGTGDIVTTGFTELGQFAFASDTALPVEVLVLHAAYGEDGVVLSWTGSPGTILPDYMVERSENGGDVFWEIPVREVPGTDPAAQDFRVIDENAPLSAEVLLYRVARELPGGRIVSDAVAVRPLSTALIRIREAFPNPFRNRTTLDFDLGRSGPLEVTLHDVAGRRLAVLVRGDHAAGSYRVQIEGQDLPSGVYVYRVATAGQEASGRLTRVR